LESRGILHLQRRARNRDDAGLERFAQALEHAAVELGQLVEKQHAAMREAHLARTRLRTAADDGASRRGVMRRAERAPPVLARLEPPAADGRDGR